MSSYMALGYELSQGLRAELSQPLDDDPNRWMEWATNHLHVKMDQMDGFIYIKDGDAVISIPADEANALAKVLEVADRIANE